MWSTTTSPTVRLSQQRPQRGVFLSAIHLQDTKCKICTIWYNTKALHQVRQSRVVVIFVPVVKRYSRDHSGTNTQSMCALRGGVGGWEAIFRNSGGVQGTMGWCEIAQCVSGSRFVLSCRTNAFFSFFFYWTSSHSLS